jgi:predicted membrane-bound mannosyltransferase
VLSLRRVTATFAGRVSLAIGAVLAAIAVHSLFYNAFFEDPIAWSALGLAPLAAAALAAEPVSERRRRAVAPQPAAVAAPQGGRTRAEAG